MSDSESDSILQPQPLLQSQQPQQQQPSPNNNQILTVIDMKSISNKTDIKRMISDVEKTLTKTQSDFVVLLNCSRFVLTDLNNREWPKYYHLSHSGLSLPSSSLTTSLSSSENIVYSRMHLLLSRIPIVRAEYFGNPLVLVVETVVPFNDLPIDIEYDNNSAKFVFVITMEYNESVTNIVQTLIERKMSTFCVGFSPNEFKSVTNSNIPLSYHSNHWVFDNYVERTNTYQFKML